MTDNFEARLRAERDRLKEKTDRASKIVAALDVLIAAYADDPGALEGPKVVAETPTVVLPTASESQKHIVVPSHQVPQRSVGDEKPVDQVTYTKERKDWIRSMIADGIPRSDILKSLNTMPGRPIASLGALNVQVKAMGLSGANRATPKPSIVEAKPEVAAEPVQAPAYVDYPARPEPDEDDDPQRWPATPRAAPPPPSVLLTVRTADIVAWATQAGVTNPRNLYEVNRARLARGLPVYGPPNDAA